MDAAFGWHAYCSHTEPSSVLTRDLHSSYWPRVEARQCSSSRNTVWRSMAGWGGVWSGVRHRVRGPRSSEERWSAWSGDHKEIVAIPTTILLYCEWRGADKLTQLASGLIHVRRTLSAPCAQCLFTNIDGPLRAERGTLSCFDGWLPEEDGRWIERRIMWQRLISAYNLTIVLLGVGWVNVNVDPCLRKRCPAGKRWSWSGMLTEKLLLLQVYPLDALQWPSSCDCPGAWMSTKAKK